MDPVILRRHGGDVVLQPRIHAGRVGHRVAAGKVGPGGQHLHFVAVGREAWQQGNDLGPAQSRKAGQRRHGGGLDAVKRHEHRFIRAKIHVGQQVQRLAFAQRRHDGLDALDSSEQAQVAKALAALQYPLIDQLVRLVGVNRGRGPGHRQRHAGPGRIQADKMRQKNHRRVNAQQFLDRAGQPDPLLHAFPGRMPQPGTVQPGLREIDKGLQGELAPRRLGKRRKTHREIGMHHTPAPADQAIQHPAQRRTQGAHHGKRQVGQPFHEGNAAQSGDAAGPLAKVFQAASLRGVL